MRPTLCLLALLVTLPATAKAGDCDFTAPRDAVLPTAGATRIVIHAEAGSLDVRGVAGLTEARVRGVACASRRDLLEEIRLDTEVRGDTVRIEADTPDSSGSWFSSRTARLDLEIEVPADLAVEVEDGSGDSRIEGVASATVEDGSGELRISDVAGAVEVEDGSGFLEVLRIGGTVKIIDGSGEVEVREVGGPVTIDDGSGSVRIDEIEGDVEISDGSGEIDVRDVRGNVVVHDDGSGSIDVARITGDFTVRNDGSGGVSHREVGGRVRVPAGG